MRIVFKVVFSFFLIVNQQVLAQEKNPYIDSIIHLITIESYRSHFYSLQTSANSNRKVQGAFHQSTDHDACRDYIYSSFSRYLGDENCYIIHFQQKDFGGLSNVIGFKKGTAPWKGLFVVSAHFGYNNNMEKLGSEVAFSPGANDNGIGVAAILEIASVLASIPTEQSVLFAA
jgi:hypothetical protein